MFRAIRDATYDDSWPDDEIGEDVIRGLEQVLREMAAGVSSFGDLVRAEAQPEHADVLLEVHRVQAALDGLLEARARLDDLLTTRTAPVVQELHSNVLATVKRLMVEMDLDQRVRRQLRLGRVSRTRPHRGHREAPPPAGPHAPPEEEPTQELRMP
jgi:predicted nucleotidyltransferase